MSELHDHVEKQVIAAAVIPVLQNTHSLQTQRETETQGLVEALNSACAFVRTVHVRTPNPSTLFGRGQLDQIAADLEENKCDLLVIDGMLSPIQQRNLERDLQCKVIDRTGLILEIFGLRARTKAGRLQVETARLAYERSRLVRTWTHLERQRGGQGFLSGPGETQIESDRRMIDNALLRLRKQLGDVEKTRRLQRAGRDARNVPIVALVGYTNAGKSTLFNRLANSNVFAKDMPFATLDPTIRQVELPGGQEIALVDTVGFITDLPTALIESFKATLEETMEADLILHVHDASSPDVEEQSEDVEAILEDLEEMFDADAPPTVHVWNKVDCLSASDRTFRKTLISNYEEASEHVLVSAREGEGIDALIDLISKRAFEQTEVFDLTIPVTEGDALAWLHRNGRILSKDVENTSGDTRVRVLLSTQNQSRFSSQYPQILRPVSRETFW